MSSLTEHRCLNHPAREAAARCPECRRYYCRECVTEHEDRVICASCLRRITRPRTKRRFPLAILARTVALLAGLIIAWLTFYAAGQVLLRMPSAFHEGTVWRADFLDVPPK